MQKLDLSKAVTLTELKVRAASKIVATVMRLDGCPLAGRSRKERDSLSRQLTAYIAVTVFGVTQRRTSFYAKVDHATINYALGRVSEILEFGNEEWWDYRATKEAVNMARRLLADNEAAWMMAEMMRFSSVEFAAQQDSSGEWFYGLYRFKVLVPRHQCPTLYAYLAGQFAQVRAVVECDDLSRFKT